MRLLGFTTRPSWLDQHTQCLRKKEKKKGKAGLSVFSARPGCRRVSDGRGADTVTF